MPAARHIAVLVDPANPTSTASTLKDVEKASRSMGLQIRACNASTAREIDSTFASFVDERPDALAVGSGTFFLDRRVQLAYWPQSTRFRQPIRGATSPKRAD